VVGITPEIGDPFMKHVRQSEVELYLHQNNLSSESWIAIDDTESFYRFNATLILTDGRKGFSDNDGVLLRKMLQNLNSRKKEL
jgi:hypothetical protein